jgi:O-antigen ligase
VAAVAGFAYAFVDRRVSVPQRARRAAGAVVLATLVAAVIGSIAAFFVTVDRPGHFLERKWHSFKTLPAQETGSSHLASLGSNRYDFWRVELDEFVRHPLAGVGARGFAASYLQHRRSPETPARGHSLVLDTLSETGIVGMVLLVAAVGFPFAGAAARGRQTALLAGLAAAGVYGLAHASVDWIWTFPAVGVPFFLLLGIANAGGPGDRAPPLLRTRVAVPIGVVLVLLAVGAFGLPWAATRLTSAALRDPAHAAGDLRWARRLDPLAIEPFTVEAKLAGTAKAALEPLRKALAKQPRVAALHYLLGSAYLRAGDRSAARRELARAHELDPRDEIVKRALERARG